MLHLPPPEIRILIPIRSFFSSSVTRRPSDAALQAAMIPAAPAPIPTTSGFMGDIVALGAESLGLWVFGKIVKRKTENGIPRGGYRARRLKPRLRRTQSRPPPTRRVVNSQ